MKSLPCRLSALAGVLALAAISACSATGPEDVNILSDRGTLGDLPEEGASAESRASLTACSPYLGSQCYWMENTSGNFCWVPATWVGSFQGCYAQDSCDGGLSHSGGGCYKWAECSGCARYPWQ